MTSWLATGPPGMVWVWPTTEVTSWPPEKFCTTPIATRTRPPTIAIGSRIRSTVRVRSTQKLPSRSVLARAKPRISAIATTMPTAADRKFCTARPANWTRWPIVTSGEYDCQLVFDDERRGGVERQP